MSHFTVLQTQIVETPSLVKALGDLGFAEVEVHETPGHLYGFQGDVRPQTAEVIVRRRHVGTASNDIGFKLQQDGTFAAIISDYDRQKYSAEWLGRLAQRYAYHATLTKLEEQGFTVASEEVEQGGRIHLVLRRMA